MCVAGETSGHASPCLLCFAVSISTLATDAAAAPVAFDTLPVERRKVRVNNHLHLNTSNSSGSVAGATSSESTTASGSGKI